MTHAVAIVPAFDRADTVGATVTALRTVPDVLDVIVVDDGSRDRTAAAAAAAGARVIELARNRGKAAAVAAGVAASGAPDVYLLIDADLGSSAALAADLLQPVALGEADMTIAIFGGAESPSGFGLVKAFAARVLRSETGLELAEPLSGQRAVRGPLMRSLQLAPGFGLEIGLTLDAADRGARISEVEIGFSHRQTGRDFSGFAHRARIGRHVYLAVVARTGWPKAVYSLAASLLGSVISAARGVPVRDRGQQLGGVARQSWQRARQLRFPRSLRDRQSWRPLRRRRARGP
ncbi:MAG: glycosyltransferase [Acidimicrobiaceae bacterium]|nr:glycosyltransferase [Acidimicrobiaceae bacterium]MXV87262.1 glycosyltransferase [Acidimicrobiales bacterium]MDE0677311.1 glycosyltransferase [Acidimicrobiaceae bacterium]MYA25279.1 glycosyltransferase [Acidimicrobiales bacterium]MYB80573.1 glycosyltransferase [Acidimicrobiales bacterium]